MLVAVLGKALPDAGIYACIGGSPELVVSDLKNGPAILVLSAESLELLLDGPVALQPPTPPWSYAPRTSTLPGRLVAVMVTLSTLPLKPFSD